MLSELECKALRDALFAMRFDTGHKESVFELLAVVPGTSDADDATIHFAFAPAVWERAGCEDTPAEFVEELLGRTAFADRVVSIERHVLYEEAWPIDWSVTANRHIPQLVLLELPGGRITGTVMRETCCNTHVAFANQYVEPDEVVAGIARLRDLEYSNTYGSWVKESNIDGPSLNDVLDASPESTDGRKFVLVYRSDEWGWGIWNNGKERIPRQGGIHLIAGRFDLTSVSDFYGTRASRAKRTKRAGLEPVRKTAFAGDYAAFNAALMMVHDEAVPHSSTTHNYETNEAVRSLCDWWNAVAPKKMRHAGAFRVYTWDADNRTFVAGDPEEPALQVNDSFDYKSHALFESDQGPTVLVWFLRGRRFNTGVGGGTMIYCADGDQAYDSGLGLAEVDEAYYSLRGLETLASDIGFRAIAHEHASGKP